MFTTNQQTSQPSNWKTSITNSVNALGTQLSKITKPQNNDNHEKLEAANIALAAKNTAIDGLANDLNTKNVKINQLQNQVSYLAGQDAEKDLKIKKLEENLQALEADYQQSNFKIRRLENGYEELADDNEASELLIRKLKRDLQAKDEKMANMRKIVDNAKKYLEKNGNKNSDYKKKIEDMRQIIEGYEKKLPFIQQRMKDFEFTDVISVTLEGEALERRGYARSTVEQLLLDVAYAINERLGVDLGHMYCNGCGQRGFDRADMEHHLSVCRYDGHQHTPGVDGWIPRGCFSFFPGSDLADIDIMLQRRPLGRALLPNFRDTPVAPPLPTLEGAAPLPTLEGAAPPPTIVDNDTTSLLNTSLDSLNLDSDGEGTIIGEDEAQNGNDDDDDNDGSASNDEDDNEGDDDDDNEGDADSDAAPGGDEANDDEDINDDNDEANDVEDIKDVNDEDINVDNDEDINDENIHDADEEADGDASSDGDDIDNNDDSSDIDRARLPTSDSASSMSDSTAYDFDPVNFGVKKNNKYKQEDYQVEDMDALFGAARSGFGTKVLNVEFNVSWRNLLKYGVGTDTALESDNSTTVEIATPPHITGGIVGVNGRNINRIRAWDGCNFAKLWRGLGIVASFDKKEIAKKYTLMMLGICREFGKNPKRGQFTTNAIEKFMKEFCEKNDVRLKED